MRLIAALFVAVCLPLGGAGLLAQAEVPQNSAQVSLSFAPVVKTAAPAVVNIYAKRVVERRSPFSDDPFFSQFFRDFTGPRVQNSLGSGVILGDGLVVSNYHVVENATDIRVVLADRREFDGTLVLADETADLAVIKLRGGDHLLGLDFADSDAVEVGDLVLAIGNPFGVGQTVSSGIVSGLARSGGGGGGLMQGGRYFIQTDAPINPGNSGGALVDMQGRLVGINTQIVTRSGGSNGIGFAIPANLVRQVVEQARLGNDRFERPWSGAEVQMVDADMANALGLELPRGVMVRNLAADSPFAQAGLRRGDVLLSLAGEPVNAAPELDFRMATLHMGATVPFTFQRDGRQKRGEVVMQPAPKRADPKLVTIEHTGPFQGLTLTQLGPDMARGLGQPMNGGGVVVVGAVGPAARTGFLRGDVIHTINHQTLTAPSDVEALVTQGSRWWRVEFTRAGRRITARFN